MRRVRIFNFCHTFIEKEEKQHLVSEQGVLKNETGNEEEIGLKEQ